MCGALVNFQLLPAYVARELRRYDTPTHPPNGEGGVFRTWSVYLQRNLNIACLRSAGTAGRDWWVNISHPPPQHPAAARSVRKAIRVPAAKVSRRFCLPLPAFVALYARSQGGHDRTKLRGGRSR